MNKQTNYTDYFTTIYIINFFKSHHNLIYKTNRERKQYLHIMSVTVITQ